MKNELDSDRQVSFLTSFVVVGLTQESARERRCSWQEQAPKETIP